MRVHRFAVLCLLTSVVTAQDATRSVTELVRACGNPVLRRAAIAELQGGGDSDALRLVDWLAVETDSSVRADITAVLRELEASPRVVPRLIELAAEVEGAQLASILIALADHFEAASLRGLCTWADITLLAHPVEAEPTIEELLQMIRHVRQADEELAVSAARQRLQALEVEWHRIATAELVRMVASPWDPQSGDDTSRTVDGSTRYEALRRLSRRGDVTSDQAAILATPLARRWQVDRDVEAEVRADVMEWQLWRHSVANGGRDRARLELASALLSVARTPETRATAWAAMLRAPDIESRAEAARAIARIGSAAAHAVPALRWALCDHPLVAREAAIALGAIGPDAASVAESLRQATRRDDPQVAAAARAALEQITR